eukprot:15340231-Ditylum_brightwellii.AAC.1
MYFHQVLPTSFIPYRFFLSINTKSSPYLLISTQADGSKCMTVFKSACGYANTKSIALVHKLYSFDMIIIVLTAGHDTTGA